MYNRFVNFGLDVNSGLLLFNLYRFFYKYQDIKDSIKFNYSHISFENKFWNLLTDNELKLLWLQYLIWNSLKMNNPIIANTISEKNSGHSILIIGIEPNIEKPLETNYIIRNPNPDENQLIEEKISAIDLFSLLFNPFLCFGEILINTTVVSKFFIPYIIIEHLKVGSINIQDLLKNLNQFTDEDLETLLSSEDTLCSSEAEQILLSLLNKE
ncbi:hypothetical protein [Spiroplasma endosymbiont of Colias croceus]|uniref:hypothetical protein n=1 Tax=Spiroplasma endosymbiont of Colias croceus TaxID=3066310 RepID=UPI0030D166EB